MRCIVALTIGMLMWPSLAHGQPLKVSPGFEVVEFADSKLANDIQVMTVDPRGRVIVAGRGYIRILVDDDGDGRADRAIEFASSPKDGAMGLLWEGDSLFVTGDGGLRRFRSKSGDKADGPSELIRAMKTGGEHAAHAIQRGPDGWLYVLCGNDTGIDKSFADLATSPVKEPIAGCVLRFQPDLRKCEVVAHGFRNPYAFDFNLEGDLFTFDSDNERCVGLPWYEPTRFYHVIEGRHYGWLNPQHAVAWRRPAYFCDVIASAATLGRGSPTGVACYRHNQFPPEYQGGFFLADWTFGKVYFAALERNGATYVAKPRVFLESQGDHGFAPTACAIDPKTGDLYVSIGGRGTRGAVYRVRHAERFKAMQGKLAALKIAPRSLEWNAEVRKEYEDKLWSKSPTDHLRAMQIARRQGSFLGDSNASSPFAPRQYFDDLSVRLAQADLTADLLTQVSPRHAAALKASIRKNDQIQNALGTGMAILKSDRSTALNRGIFLLTKSKFPERQLEGLRLVQLALGDIGDRKTIGTIWEGYTPREEVADFATARLLTKLFPAGHPDVDREIARTLALLGHADLDLRARILARRFKINNPVEDIHYLACFARLGGDRGEEETKAVASTLLDLDRKIAAAQINRDSNWAPRVSELYRGLAEQDPNLHEAVVSDPSFGRPDHALFCGAEGFPKQKAARIFLKRWKDDKQFAMNSAVADLFDALPAADVLPIVRVRWGTISHEPAFMAMLAKSPEKGDRERFVAGLSSPQARMVAACVEGLDKLDIKADAEEWFGLVRALTRAAGEKKPLPHAAKLAARLDRTTGQKRGVDVQGWIGWLAKEHPEFGARLANPDGVDLPRWERRLAKVDWEKGDAPAGKAVFAKANCLTCHGSSTSLGPDLAGIGKRFSRPDLLTAILQPSKEVAARYRTTTVETRDGKVYQGIVIYDAVDSLILQGGAAETIRLNGAEVVSRRLSENSLMPAGLLDALSEQEIVNLMAYLRDLR